MSPIVKFALPVALLLAFRPAAAQLMGPMWETNVTLTRADLDLIEATLHDKIHGRPAGTSAAWRADRIPQPSARDVAAVGPLRADQLSAARRRLEAVLRLAPMKAKDVMT